MLIKTTTLSLLQPDSTMGVKASRPGATQMMRVTKNAVGRKAAAEARPGAAPKGLAREAPAALTIEMLIQRLLPRSTSPL
jgi:hypothetical protein